MLQDSARAAVSFGTDQTVRRDLKRWWVAHPQRWVAWLMLNPSTATAVKDDPTTKRLTHFTRAWGYDGWIAVNVYPFVSSTPIELWKRVANSSARDELQANLQNIEAAGRIAALRVVAFGAQLVSKDRQAWLERCLEAFGRDERFWCLGTSSRGQPLHPMARGTMRVPNERQPMLWERPQR